MSDEIHPPPPDDDAAGTIDFIGAGLKFETPEEREEKEEEKEKEKEKEKENEEEWGEDEAVPHRSRIWPWIPALLFLSGASLIFSTQRGVGYAWDEAYYYEPARAAAAWIVEGFPGVIPFDAETLDYYWGERHEHPSVQKILSGLSLLAFERALGPILAMRLPMAALFGATLALIYFLGRRAWSAPAGLVAALAYLAMPQVFGLSHFASMEPCLAFMTMLAVYCFVRGLDSGWWAILAGSSLGALLATKINGFFLIPPLILWGYAYARPRCVHNFFSMAVLGPIVFVALWPWLWPDPARRTLDYLQFHAQHQQTAVYFLGEKFGYGDVNAPWFYPSAMIGATTPLTILALAAIGILATLAGLRRRALPTLFLLLAFVNWAVASAPSTPKYDGVRLFLPLFPFLALLAGGGAQAIIGAIARPAPDPEPWPLRAKLLAWGIGLVVLAEGALGAAGSHPYYLSYFSRWVGGAAGAESMGFETTYWGEAVNDEVLDALNDPRLLPPGSKLKPLALHELCFQHMQSWGMLRRDLRIGGDPPYDAHLLLWRRGFFSRPERALAESGMFAPMGEWKTRDGVRLLTLYKTGADFERYWPTTGPAPPAPEVTLP